MALVAVGACSSGRDSRTPVSTPLPHEASRDANVAPGDAYEGESYACLRGDEPGPRNAIGNDDLAVGDEFGCVLAGGAVWCWGRHGATICETAQPVHELGRPRKLAASGSRICALQMGPSVVCGDVATWSFTTAELDVREIFFWGDTICGVGNDAMIRCVDKEKTAEAARLGTVESAHVLGDRICGLDAGVLACRDRGATITVATRLSILAPTGGDRLVGETRDGTIVAVGLCGHKPCATQLGTSAGSSSISGYKDRVCVIGLARDVSCLVGATLTGVMVPKSHRVALGAQGGCAMHDEWRVTCWRYGEAPRPVHWPP